MSERLNITADNTSSLNFQELVSYLLEIVAKSEKFMHLLSAKTQKGNYGAEEEVHRAITPQDFIDVMSFGDVDSEVEKTLLQFLAEQEIVLSNIHFCFENFKEPEDSEKLGKLFSLFKSVHISHSIIGLSSITTSKLSQKDIALSFSNCEFQCSWNLSDYKLSKNRFCFYENCEFGSGIFFYVSKDLPYELTKFEGTQLFRCKVFCGIVLHNAHFLSDLFSQVEYINECSLEKELFIDNVLCNGNFELKNAVFDKVVLKNSNFGSKFKLVESKVRNFNVLDVDFTKGCSFFKTKFDSFNLEKTTFLDYVIFEECQFGSKQNKSTFSSFKHVTFERFSNFRSTVFKSGLDISKANFLEPPNFLHTQVPLDGSTRETFRIIKHSFDSVGNYLEANKFFALEMEKYREELSREKDLSIEKLVFGFNSFFSSFGQSVVKPVRAFIVTAIFAAFTYSDFVDNLPLMSIGGDTGPTRYLIDTLNHWADSLVFSSILKDGYEFISLIFGILLTVFSWMTIVAFKRLTRR